MLGQRFVRLSLEGPEGQSIDASETSQEIPTAYPGETSYLLPDTPAIEIGFRTVGIGGAGPWRMPHRL